ncbi:MAG: Ig-like domain-containing protein [Synergistaceae bacterium]|nr:Ig-like domain-containing protein [Synergistaceae bacterium]
MNRKNFLRSFRSSQPVTGKRGKLSFILTLTILILMLSSILSVNVARADELTAAAISDSTIYGTWTGSGGSGTATANGQTIPITMSYVGVEILYPETYAVGNKNVTLRSLVVNANTGEALHEFDWNSNADEITMSRSGNTWTFTNSAIGERLTLTLSSETTATAVLYGNRNGISGTISGIKMTKGGDIYNIHPDPGTNNDTGNDTNPIVPGPMTYVTISVTDVGGSSPMRGLTADGASQLLITAVTNKDGYVAFSMTDGLGLSIKLDEAGTSSSNIMRAKASVVGTYETTAIITAPEAFPSGTFPQRDFTVYATFAEDINDLGTSEIKASQILTLHAAPVVLIHGIFGKSENTFGKGEGTGIWPSLEYAGLTPHPWNYVNSQGPNEVIAENQESALASIIKEIQRDLSVMKGIVCKKVDIVAHSMGGLMARRFLQADSFAKSNKPVRRIITVATPHRGSPWADIMIGNTDSWQQAMGQATLKTIGETYLEWNTGAGRDATSAWRDLREANSIAFGFHGNVPMYSIYGDARDTNPIPEIAMNYVNNNVFPDQRHDVAVSVPSAMANFSDKGSHGHTGAEFWHSDICNQHTIGEEVLELLKGPVDKFKVFSNSAASFQTYAITDYNYSAASADDNTINYLVEDGINLTAEPSVLNSGGTVTLKARADAPLSGDLFMAVTTANDSRRFMSLKPSNDEKTLFETQVTLSSSDVGVLGARCFAEGDDGLVYLSNSALFTVKPDLNDTSVTGLELSDSLASVYTHVNSAVGIGLYAKLSDGREFDVSSPKMGTVWTASDPDIAEVTDTGLIKGLNVGSTTITASYSGFSVAVSVDVAVAYSYDNNSDADSRNSSSGSGGCSSGLAGISELLALALIITLTYTIQQKRKKD